MTLAAMLAESDAGEGHTNATVSYQFRLDGALSEDEVQSEVRARYPVFRRVLADHFGDRPGNPAHWTVTVFLRRAW